MTENMWDQKIRIEIREDITSAENQEKILK